jgi:hypothetical protein
MKKIETNELVSMALVGYERHKIEIQKKMAAIRSRLAEIGGVKCYIGLEGRMRIAAAQRKRWAKTKKAEAGVLPIDRHKEFKRSLSARKHMSAGQLKRWAKTRKAG